MPNLIKEKLVAAFYAASAFACIFYQGFLHNQILKKIYPDTWIFTILTFVDFIFGILFFPSIYFSKVKLAELRLYRKENPFANNAALEKKISKLFDVVTPILLWILYIGLLIVKIGTIFYGFKFLNPALLADPAIGDEVQWATLFTAGLFLLEVWSNGSVVPDSIRDAFLTSGSIAVLMDLFDSTDILDLWFKVEYKQVSGIDSLLVVAVVCHCISLLFPLAAIYQIMWTRYGTKKFNAAFEVFSSLLRAFLVNLPFLVLRCIAAHAQRCGGDSGDGCGGHVRFQTKALIVKNILAIVFAVRGAVKWRKQK